ncbi:hypothetical protein SmJEL517_g03980 [Synchytrium microbalum]|uniref:Molybdenum cofactor sulfurase n=1 Tax=Synchytrium microbalum TaxID=1806994 RepID=A0A507C0W0_9FUNG|nr:uncharacterized protein SmJEL517_g03980 [Synchytrium microbalum]TPX33008.1 hypothetical protein SmJEL517_g03980 [Synchytrium microbalum]
MAVADITNEDQDMQSPVSMDQIGAHLASLRNHDFPQLASNVYLDHAGTTLPAKSLIDAYTADISATLYGNPHSFSSPSAVATAKRLASVRARILKHLNTSSKDYSVIFTANTTAALKLLGESLNWDADNNYYYLSASHTSVLGIRQSIAYARRHLPNNGDVKAMTPNDVEAWISSADSSSSNSIQDTDHVNLFAYPAQCNFSGTRYPLDWVNQVKSIKGGLPWKVLLDIAAYSTTTPMELSKYPADFAVLSFYKMFGFPTNLGALIVRNDALPHMHKRYFGGGSVSAISYNNQWQLYRESAEKFEDGTLPFLEIMALHHAFEYIETNIPPRLGSNPWNVIRSWTAYLTDYTRGYMKSMRHANSSLVCKIYDLHTDTGDNDVIRDDRYTQGPVIAFNIMKPDGLTFVGYSEVAKMSAIHDVHVRTGCFCNPGACQLYLGLSDEDVQENAEIHGHVCGDDMDIVNNKPTGAIRISFGWMNTLEDCKAWLRFLSKYYQLNAIEHLEIQPLRHVQSTETNCTLSSLSLFPIKSCGGYTPTSEWPIGPEGLLYDRNWMLVDESGIAMSQKRVPRMCLIKPVRIDLLACMMVLEAPGMAQLKIYMGESVEEAESVRARVCGDRIQTFIETRTDVSSWFSTFLNMPCQLVRCNMNIESRLDKRSKKKPYNNTTTISLSSIDTSPKIAFANESQFLLVSLPSYEMIRDAITTSKEKDSMDVSCWRANIVVSGNGLVPFGEDEWSGREIEIDGQVFQVQGPCNRCQMICINQATGERSKEPFSTLALKRKQEGKINFGQHLAHIPSKSSKPYVIRTGSRIRIL